MRLETVVVSSQKHGRIDGVVLVLLGTSQYSRDSVPQEFQLLLSREDAAKFCEIWQQKHKQYEIIDPLDTLEDLNLFG